MAVSIMHNYALIDITYNIKNGFKFQGVQSINTYKLNAKSSSDTVLSYKRVLIMLMLATMRESFLNMTAIHNNNIPIQH